MNKRRAFILIVLMSVIALWWLRSFFMPENLAHRILNGTASEYELSYAKAQKLPAYFISQRQGQETGNIVWLNATRALATLQVSYALELAQYYKQQNNQLQEKFWLTHAWSLKSDQAAWLLANIEWQEKNYQAASDLLNQLIKNQSEKYIEKSLVLLIEITLSQGKLTKANSLIAKLKMLKVKHSLLDELSFYSVFSFNQNSAELMDSCDASVQMFATELSHLRKVSQLIAQFNQTPLKRFVCFTPPRYISKTQLHCLHQGSETIRCSESYWQPLAPTINTRFIGVMLEQGGANVNHGILYIDSADTISVFIHEIMHLLGFIDEYPLPINHAKCDAAQTSPFALNVAVLPKTLKGDKQTLRKQILEQLAWGSLIKSETPILTQLGKEWRLGTPVKYQNEIGLFMSRTCDKRQSEPSVKSYSLQAFKPLSRLTNMEYQELEFPTLYLQLLSLKTEQFFMPSFLQNIALTQTKEH